MTESLTRICRSHSKMIGGRSDNDSQIAHQVAKVVWHTMSSGYNGILKGGHFLPELVELF
jgi:2-phosphoglycerate kinase